MDRRCIAASLLGLLTLCMGCGDDHDSPLPAATATATALVAATATPTRSVVATSTAAASATPTSAAASPTPTSTVAATVTAVQTVTANPTATPELPEITIFGLARADDLPLQPNEIDDAGRPVFERIQGQAMTIVLEARRGISPLELSAYDPGGGPRGVEFLVSRPLGDGSPAVCDYLTIMMGGVPGIDPPLFSDEPEVQNAIDDLGCRVNDGAGAPLARLGQNACTRMEPSFEYGFVDPTSELQYCLPIARAWNFAVGDTIVAARVRDMAGNVSATRELVVRVLREQPFVCDQGLGEHAFTVRRPQSRLALSTSDAVDASADPWLPATLRLCAGRPLGEGLYPLTLREDVVLGIPLQDGGVLCAKVTARGSSGTLDCDGGTPVDVRASQDLDAVTRIVVEDGLGIDAGTGAAIIRAPVTFLQLPTGASSDDCQDAAYPASFNGALSTATGSAQIVDFNSAVVAEASAAGASFSCADWLTGGGGAFVLPIPIVNGPAGDVAAALVLSDQ